MNKRYIDFVPKAASTPATSTAPKATPKSEEAPTLRPAAKFIDITAVKAKKLTRMPLPKKKPAEKKPEKSVQPAKKTEDKAMKAAVEDAHNLDKKLKIPKVSFVNTEKIIKRPLSKNVYTKKIESPKEEPKGPVTIIAKPEKDSKASLIVTIIITIILGAAAGTVAFLLLPK